MGMGGGKHLGREPGQAVKAGSQGGGRSRDERWGGTGGQRTAVVSGQEPVPAGARPCHAGPRACLRAPLLPRLLMVRWGCWASCFCSNRLWQTVATGRATGPDELLLLEAPYGAHTAIQRSRRRKCRKGGEEEPVGGGSCCLLHNTLWTAVPS